MFSSISNETKSELEYNNTPISKIVAQQCSLGLAIGHLWFKKDLPHYLAMYFQMILTICADHGPAVSGGINTIITTRAGKDLVSSLCSGLLTVGPRFRGAIGDASYEFFTAVQQGISPEDFVKNMKKQERAIPGIGHRIKTKDNPDVRVQLLDTYSQKNFSSNRYTTYAR